LAVSSGWVMLGDRKNIGTGSCPTHLQLGQISRRFSNASLGPGPFAFACSTNAGPGVLDKNPGGSCGRFFVWVTITMDQVLCVSNIETP